ncbi:hypothetical protein Zmor_020414 [Zophobas morio]|uniref:Shavenoid isoform B-like N-terminal domain-containing protein n=1 Tax=Zophobas morio TaxID=2755281 RepID=A0AA38MAB0_9CUCU|nr:hypothetical protein Zmor_020414 [Zophobas morio]
MAVAGLLMLVLPWLANALEGMTDVSLQVVRQNKGDVFNPEGQKSCKPETCVGLSSGTASATAPAAPCTCQCHPHLPAFREDLRICVDDIHGPIPIVDNSKVRPSACVTSPPEKTSPGPQTHALRDLRWMGDAVMGIYVEFRGYVDAGIYWDSDVLYLCSNCVEMGFLRCGRGDERGWMGARH